MNALFSTSSPTQRILLVDIGGMSIGASLVEVRRDDVPSIFYQKRIRTPVRERKDIRVLDSLVRETLEDVLRDVLGVYHGNNWDGIDGVHVILGAPWCLPSISIAKKDFAKPQKVTRQIISEIVEKERMGMRSKHPNLDIIEAEALDVRLDGYKIEDSPTGKVEHVGVDIFSTQVSERTVEDIERIIGKFFAVENMRFHSSTLTLYATMRGIFSGPEKYLIMDISGDVTEVLLVHNDTLVEIGSIPVGAHDVARTVAETYKTTAEEALSRLTIIEEGNAAKKDTRMNVTILKAQDRWKDPLAKLLGSFEYAPRIPEQVFYTTSSNTKPLFEKILVESGLFKYGDVFFLDANSFAPFVGYTSPRYRDPFLALSTIYTHMYTIGLEE